MTVEHKGDDAIREDPLMYVLTGEPLPPELERDAAFVAEYRAAGADTAALRDDLARIGEALCREPAGRRGTKGRLAPRRVAFRARRRWALVAAAVAAMAIGAVVTGVVRDDAQNRGAPPEAALTPVGRLACAEVVAEGLVVDAARVDGGSVKVTLRVDRHYKPERGERLLSFSAPPQPAGAEGAAGWSGSRLLVLVPQAEGAVAEVFREGEPAPPGAPEGGSGDALEWGRSLVADSLEESRGKPCPAQH
ncbi:hypothetical protein [Streptomyces sp. MUM 178J]|uniref:hypothetical protein n=1 Tax=Streptomyces sp. MUM 178J TaxID=2791991 RepID=UPI001F037927|nr:hypothetical protein [Streptomyces sp. MUM 178J]WRQ81567.1 hypothetical protein I3F59_020655 [Streptomyces sp. MUM 178J]